MKKEKRQLYVSSYMQLSRVGIFMNSNQILI